MANRGNAIAALIGAFGLAGCGGGGGAEAPATPAETTVLTALVMADTARVRAGAACVADIELLKSCIGFNNLAAPDFRLGPFDPGSDAGRGFADRTGIAGGEVFAVAGPSPEVAAAGAFVQVVDPQTFGIHVDTRTRTGNLSSINPLYQFHRFPPPPGEADMRVFPWSGAFGTNVDVVISVNIRVQRLAATLGSAAYGQAVMDWFDRTSGGHFYFLAQAFGTIPAVDNVLIDSVSGRAIVATSFSPSSGYGHGSVSGEHHEFRLSREDFQRVLASARTLQPTLSPSPADYMLDDHHFNNEVAGDGEIGITLGAMTLRIVRR
jgi:hypothetical protein